MPTKTKGKIIMDDITMVKGDGRIITYNGEWFDVFNPNPDDVDIEDIVHALANQCRFTGHTRQFYSVAQHSVLVSRICPSEFALHGLLHDASEAYLSDIARPIKKHPEFGPFYLEVEANLENAVYKRFNIDPALGHEVVKIADDILLRTEARDLMPPSFPVYPGETLTESIVPWSPARAKREFIVAFLEHF